MKYIIVVLLAISVHSAEYKRPVDVEVNRPIHNSIHKFVASFPPSLEEIDNDGEYILKETQIIMDDTPTNQDLVDLDESLSTCGPFEIDIRELTIVQIREHFQTGRLTSVDLTQCYINRIAEIDVYLRSVIEVNPEAIQLAERADMERSEGLNEGQLHGIPILIKDNIGTADLMETTAGALALEGLKPIVDAEVVMRLRKAGAIILGKASLSEWANYRDSNIPSGWNGRRGQTVNAYVLNQNPSGSSSGSGVSISANLAVISLGTETDGSIISPSTRNAIVGLKPTLGAVSTRGVIPLAFSNDVVGPMVRTVEDAAILMGAISDIDLEGCDTDVSSCLPNRNFRIGIVRDPFWNPSDSSISPIISQFENILDILNTNGLASVIDPVTVPFEYRMNRQAVNIILRHEFKDSLNEYLRNNVEHLETELNRNIYTLADIIRFNEMNPQGFNQNHLIYTEATNGLRNKTYVAALHEYRRDSTRYLDSIFSENSVDVLASPCYSNGTPLLYSYGAAAGYPSITVPVGTYNSGLPFGLCLLGQAFSEAVLLKLGFFIEQSRPTERPMPRFIGN